MAVPDQQTSLAENSKDPRTFRYDAFLSYSHVADRPLAEALETRLEKFGKPWYRRQLINVFRDETSITANPEMWPFIATTLGGSAHFILLASPTATESKWVKKEVCYWITDGKCDNPESLDHSQILSAKVKRLIIVLADGTIEWDDDGADFNWKTTNAVPIALRQAFGGEPGWIDLRRFRSDPKRALDGADKDFLMAVAKLSAPIRGLELEEAIAGHDREHRKTIRLFGFLVVGLAIGLMLAVAATWYALAQQRQSNQSAIASSLQAASIANGNGDVGRAALWYSEAFRLMSWSDARHRSVEQLLDGSLQRAGEPLIHDDAVTSVAVSSDGSYIATGCNNGQIFLWDARSRNLIHSSWSVSNFAFDLAFFAGNRYVFATGMGGNRIFDIATGDTVRDVEGTLYDKLVTAGVGAIIRTSTVEGVTVEELMADRRSITLPIRDAHRTILSDDGSLLVGVNPNRQLVVFHIPTWEIVDRVSWIVEDNDRLVAFSEDATSIYLQHQSETGQTRLERRELETGHEIDAWNFDRIIDIGSAIVQNFWSLSTDKWIGYPHFATQMKT